MEVPVNLYYWMMSIMPVVLLIIFMGKLNIGAAKAALLTLPISILSSLVIFQAPISTVAMELLKALWSSMSIIAVVFTALFFHEISREAGAYHIVYQRIQMLVPNELVRILLIGVGFSSFLQGFAGFGVPVLVTAPLLIRMGLSPSWAAVLSLLGHSWAGTFGTFALAWSAMLEQVNVSNAAFSTEAAIYAALFLGVFSTAVNTLIAYAYGRWPAIKKGWTAILLLSLIQSGGQLSLAVRFPELAVFLPSGLSILALIGISKSRPYKQAWQVVDSKMKNPFHVEETIVPRNDRFFPALFPYLVIVLFSFPAILFQPVSDWLAQFSFGPPMVETRTGLGFVNPSFTQYAPLIFFKHPSFFCSHLLVFHFCTTARRASSAENKK